MKMPNCFEMYMYVPEADFTFDLGKVWARNFDKAVEKVLKQDWIKETWENSEAEIYYE